MAVVPLTVTVSLCLVLTFLLFFIRERVHARSSSAERDSLMPLAEEFSNVERPAVRAVRSSLKSD